MFEGRPLNKVIPSKLYQFRPDWVLVRAKTRFVSSFPSAFRVPTGNIAHPASCHDIHLPLDCRCLPLQREFSPSIASLANFQAKRPAQSMRSPVPCITRLARSLPEIEKGPGNTPMCSHVAVAGSVISPPTAQTAGSCLSSENCCFAMGGAPNPRPVMSWRHPRSSSQHNVTQLLRRKTSSSLFLSRSKQVPREVLKRGLESSWLTRFGASVLLTHTHWHRS